MYAYVAVLAEGGNEECDMYRFSIYSRKMVYYYYYVIIIIFFNYKILYVYHRNFVATTIFIPSLLICLLSGDGLVERKTLALKITIYVTVFVLENVT